MKTKPQNGMISIFDTLFEDNMFNRGLDIPTKSFTPTHDIIENDNEYIVDIALAGFDKNNISLDIDKNILTIKGERKINDNIKYNSKNTFYGTFKESFNLPENINSEKIDASLKNGILSIIIPKNEKMKLSKQIKIN